jgi:hypothetical protein
LDVSWNGPNWLKEKRSTHIQFPHGIPLIGRMSYTLGNSVRAQWQPTSEKLNPTTYITRWGPQNMKRCFYYVFGGSLPSFRMLVVLGIEIFLAFLINYFFDSLVNECFLSFSLFLLLGVGKMIIYRYIVSMLSRWGLWQCYSHYFLA